MKSIDSASRYALDNIAMRLSSLKKGPWTDYFNIRQSITNAVLEASGAR